jgi:SAM-dependent methyltransferase
MRALEFAQLRLRKGLVMTGKGGSGDGKRAVCPACSHVQACVWGSRDGHAIYECGACSMLFFARPISSDYDYQDYYPYLADFDRARFEWEIGIRRPKLVRQLALIRRMMPQAVTLLDVGAGPGYLCAVAKEQGFEALGIEPSRAARLAGEQQFSIAYAELDEVSAGSLDIITCHHVLEHIEWPAKFLQTLRTKLRPGGLLVLHVPHQQPLSFLLRERLMKRQSDTFCTLYYPIHINGFTARSLAYLVERGSFRVVSLASASMWSMHYDPFFVANYFRNGQSLALGAVKVAKHAARCAIDVLGNTFGRGDWVIGHFRAT